MQMNGIHHISLNVSDLEQTPAFYIDVLGLVQLDRPDAYISVPGRWLECADGRQVHLLLNEVPNRVGQHFAFAVKDLDDTIEAVEQSGTKVSNPKETPGICVQAFCSDPSGNLVEFNQRL